MSNQKKQLSEIPHAGSLILKSMPGLAYVFNAEQQLVMWNKNLELTTEYSEEELFNKHMDDFISEDFKQKNLDAFNKVLISQEKQSIEYNLITKSGKKIPIVDSGGYVNIAGKEYVIGQAIDISEQKQTEERLRLAVTELQNIKDQLQSENIYLRKEVESRHGFEKIIGNCEPLMHSLYRVEQVEKTDTTVLLQGETGTGKELFAHAIHTRSRRKNKPFVKVNCASLPDSLIESELFGHEKGAFTGAVQKQIGRFELAHGGTIFLDEIGELPLNLQSKLLHVLQDGEFERIGSSKTIKVDVRVIAATNRNLEDQIRNKSFRKDLYYRLNVYPITIAPLRDRLSDIPLLAEHFVNQFNNQMDKNFQKISVKTIKQLQNYSWPGNIRELENVIERAVIISNGSSLLIEPIIEPKFGDSDELLPLAEYERKYIVRVLEKTYWRVEGPEGAARILDMHPETLRSRMRKLEIKRPGS